MRIDMEHETRIKARPDRMNHLLQRADPGKQWKHTEKTKLGAPVEDTALTQLAISSFFMWRGKYMLSLDRIIV